MKPMQSKEELDRIFLGSVDVSFSGGIKGIMLPLPSSQLHSNRLSSSFDEGKKDRNNSLLVSFIKKKASSAGLNLNDVIIQEVLLSRKTSNKYSESQIAHGKCFVFQLSVYGLLFFPECISLYTLVAFIFVYRHTTNKTRNFKYE